MGQTGNPKPIIEKPLTMKEAEANIEGAYEESYTGKRKKGNKNPNRTEERYANGKRKLSTIE